MNHKNTGFTLLELLVVVGILAALVALALPFYQDYITQSKLVTAQADLQAFQKALALYDHSEPKLFTKTNLLPLIGTYLQDYREFEGQENPLDPWGNEYVIRPMPGTILSRGPSGTLHTTIATRTVKPDDLMVTWKPEFFVSSVRKVASKVLEVSFSRKVETIGNIEEPDGQSEQAARVSDTIFRVVYSNDVADSGDVTVHSAKAQDECDLLATTKKPDGTAANVASY